MEIRLVIFRFSRQPSAFLLPSAKEKVQEKVKYGKMFKKNDHRIITITIAIAIKVGKCLFFITLGVRLLVKGFSFRCHFTWEILVVRPLWKLFIFHLLLMFLFPSFASFFFFDLLTVTHFNGHLQLNLLPTPVI